MADQRLCLIPSMLQTPVRLARLELLNRFVMAPLTRCRADNPEFAPTPLMAHYFTRSARVPG